MPTSWRIWAALFLTATLLGGCSDPPPEWGMETGTLYIPGHRRAIWAVAPVVNLSGQRAVDPILQADLVFQQLQQVEGVAMIPVNRTVEVLASLKLDSIQSEKQAALVCDLLGCDGLIVPAITIYDPYNPPKFSAAMQLYLKPPAQARTASVNPRELARQAAPTPDQLPAHPTEVIQAVRMLDAQNGSVRDAIKRYAAGRHDPSGPLGDREYLVVMDRFCGFAYHVLIADVLNSPKLRMSSKGEQ